MASFERGAMRPIYLCVHLVAMTAAASAQDSGAGPLQTNPYTVFEGRLFVTAVTAQCAAANTFVGNAFTSVFRPKFLAADPAEAITISVGNGISIITSTAASGRIVNAPAVLTSFNGSYIGTRATLTTWNSSATLLKAPAGVNANTVAVTITGTIDNFNAAGCTVTVRGAYARKP